MKIINAGFFIVILFSIIFFCGCNSEKAKKKEKRDNAWKLYANRDYRKAVNAYREFIEKKYGKLTKLEKHDIYFMMGCCYEELCEVSQAELFYKKALEQNINQAQIYYSLFELYYRFKKRDKAIEAYKTAKNLNPEAAKEYLLRYAEVKSQNFGKKKRKKHRRKYK